MKAELIRLVDKGKAEIATALVVETGNMKNRFLESFNIESGVNGNTETHGVYFDITYFNQTAPYFPHIFDEYGYWVKYPFLTGRLAGSVPVNLDVLGIKVSDFHPEMNETLLIRGNRLIVRTSI